MKFLRLDDYLNFGDDPEKDIAFSNKSRKYDEYFFKEIKDKLPKSFVDEYFFCHGFHDWKLISTNMCYESQNKKLVVVLYDDVCNLKKSIIYYDVQFLKMDFPKNHFDDIMNNDFGIDEFLIVDDVHFSHEVYFPSGASYIVHFSNIEILSS